LAGALLLVVVGLPLALVLLAALDVAPVVGVAEFVELPAFVCSPAFIICGAADAMEKTVAIKARISTGTETAVRKNLGRCLRGRW
jgi:hypothetical protein